MYHTDTGFLIRRTCHNYVHCSICAIFPPITSICITITTSHSTITLLLLLHYITLLLHYYCICITITTSYSTITTSHTTSHYCSICICDISAHYLAMRNSPLLAMQQVRRVLHVWCVPRACRAVHVRQLQIQATYTNMGQSQCTVHILQFAVYNSISNSEFEIRCEQHGKRF